ncbi:hypothetical protein [Ligilactobacillus animalis]
MTKTKTLTLGICGPKDVGKTLLIKRVTEILAHRYTIATLTNGIFTVEKINYVPPTTLEDMDLVDELNLLHLSGKIDLIFVERPELQPAKIKTDAVIYLLDASAKSPRLPNLRGLILLNKIDLATYHRIDLATLQAQVAADQDQAEVLLTDLKDNQGLQNIVCWIEKNLENL